MAHGSAAILSQAPAEAPPTPASTFGYRFPSDAQMVRAVANALDLSSADLQDGRRMRRVNHVVQMVQLYHRQARSTGDRSGFKKRAAVAAALWPDVEGTPDVRRKWKQLHTWETIAEAAGLLKIRDGRGARALAWELLSDWERYAAVTRRGYSSAGDAPCEARRRRETRPQRHERRVRPNCRRVGNKNGSVGRLLPPDRSLFSSREKSVLRLVQSPKGDRTSDALDVQQHESGGSVDTNHRGAENGAVAAPDWVQRRIERLGAAEAAFAASFGAPSGGQLIEAVPLLEAMERFDRSAAVIAELNGWPVRESAADGFLRQLMGAELDAMQWGERSRPPHHLGYFVKPLIAEARRNELRARERRARASLGSPRSPRRGSGARHT